MMNNISIQSKLPNAGTSIFAVMSNLARELGAINLSQGFPDFPIDEKLIDLTEKYMRKGYNQYAPMQGVPELREAIAQKIKNLYNATYNPNTEITIVAGATQGLFDIFTAVVHPGDEVIFFEPAYDSYLPAIQLCGGIPKPLTLKHPDYSIDWEEVKRTISPKTRMIVINTPQNPTGSVLSQTDLQMLDEITRNTNILVLSDEVYEHLIFDGLRHESVCLYPNLVERSFVTASFGKTFHTTGWKMGYVLAPENLMVEFRKIHQFNIFTVNTPIQYAVAEYMQNPDTYLSLPNFYQQKRDFFAEHIKDSRFNIIPCKGTYFMLLDYSKISDENERDFAIRITKEFGVATVPVSPFYSNEENHQVVRVCFAKTEDTMLKAAEVLNKI
ncbi:methionine aminotransferase [Bacteroidales bacterium OttesenSCG-928-C19]|nr:methionine aminotransferase [Bacteroidales bacterium OttesenSCG-928-C19]